MTSQTLRAALASALVYIAAVTLMGRDALAALDARIISDLADPVLNAAILAWNAQHVPGTDAWYQFPNFQPTRDTLAFSEHLLGVSVVAAPIYWIGGSAVAAYNLALLLAYPLCGIAMWALVWRLTRSAAGAFIAGLAFAFAPYRASQIAHIQALTVFWAPLALLALHGLVSAAPGARRWPWLLLFGVAWLLQGAANSYYLVYFSVLVGLWALWFVVFRRRWRDLTAIAAVGALAAAPLAAILLRFVEVHRGYGLFRPLEEIAFYSADIASLACAAPHSAVWGWLRLAPCGPESLLFPGVTLVVICALGVLPARGHGRATEPAGASRSTLIFYALAAFVTWTLSWGPAPVLQGEPALPQGPFAWLMLVPGIGGLRVPGRFWMMTVLCLSVVAGLVVARLRQRLPRASKALVMLAAVGLLVDGWTRIPAVPLLGGPPNPEVLRGGVGMVVPAGVNRDYDTWAEFHAVLGGWRAVNGYSGFEPPHYFALRDVSAKAHPVLLLPFASQTDLHVIVNEGDNALNALVGRQEGVEFVGQGGGWRQYRVPRSGALPPTTPGGTQHALQAVWTTCLEERAPLAADGDIQTRWHCGPQLVGQQLTAELRDTAAVGAVVTALGPFVSDYPRRLAIETSRDGKVWDPAYNDEVYAEALAAALHDPKAYRLVVTFPAREARYIRLRSEAADPVWYWSIAELEVWSGAR